MTEIKSQEDLEAYDRGVRVAEEEARQQADGTWQSAANIKPRKGDALMIIKDQFNEEYNALQDYLNGKIKVPEKTKGLNKAIYKEPLYYFEFPEMFEKDITAIDDALGDLSESDFAWIKNTRALIKKYRAVVFEKITAVA